MSLNFTNLHGLVSSAEFEDNLSGRDKKFTTKPTGLDSVLEKLYSKKPKLIYQFFDHRRTKELSRDSGFCLAR